MDNAQNQPPQTPTAPVQPNPEALAPKTKLIHLMIRNRRQILYDGEVRAVTSRNDTGTFDVLPEHANFISSINTQITIHKIDGGKQLVHLNNGLMKVKNSSIRCFIDLIAPEAPKKPAV